MGTSDSEPEWRYPGKMGRGGRDASESLAPGRRDSDRVPVQWAVDCEAEETFLYASIANLSALGVFVASREPLPLGTRVTLSFRPPGFGDPLVVDGEVQWVNPARLLAPTINPGMGIRFVGLTADERARLVELVATIAYVRDAPN